VTYTSNGSGTFNINPISGLSGFYIGDTNLSTTLTEIKSDYTGKISTTLNEAKSDCTAKISQLKN